LIDDGYLKQDTERTIQLKGCDYAWGYANLGVHFTAGSNVKVAGLGEGVTKIISASSLSSTKISDLGYDVSSNFEATSSNRCGALKAGSRANFGPAWDKFFYAPPGNDGPETSTRVTFEDLTVTGFVNEDRITNIGDGFFRFARVTFDTNLGRLLFYDAYTPSWGEFYHRNKLEFDQVTFVRNTGTFMLLHKQTTMDHWHFKDCVYQENTYCGRGSDGRSGPASTVPNGNLGRIISHSYCTNRCPNTADFCRGVENTCCDSNGYCGTEDGTNQQVFVEGQSFVNQVGSFGPGFIHSS
jgi:hypothetical protein